VIHSSTGKLQGTARQNSPGITTQRASILMLEFKGPANQPLTDIGRACGPVVLRAREHKAGGGSIRCSLLI
jgi:hypothetical protein